MTHKYYDVLGIPKESTRDEIKKAYKKLAIQCHPDKGGDQEKFKEVSKAYQVLSDDEKRRQYDQLGDERFNEGGMEGQGFDPRDIFAQFFGGGMGGMEGGFEFPFGHGFGPGGPGHHGQPRPQKCPDHRHVWQISLREAYFGVEKMLKITVQKPCRQCVETCYACQGRGSITHMQRMGFFTQMSTRPCGECNGQGRSVKAKKSCGSCSGKGSTSHEHRVELRAPKGVQTGHNMRIRGLGEQSVDKDELNGDLIIEVLVQNHPVFKRDGNNLHVDQPITFVETIVGKSFILPHFDGDFEIRTKDLGIINPHTKYTIPNKGINGGNLIIQFHIDYPTYKLDDDKIDKIKETFKLVQMV